MQSHYTLRPSRHYVGLLSILCALLLIAVVSLPGAFEWRLGGGLSAFALCVSVGLREARLKFPRSCVAFRLESENGITLIQRNGEHVTGIIAGGVVVPWLVLLNVQQEEGRRRSLVLLPDSMNRDAFRRLRVALRWNRGA